MRGSELKELDDTKLVQRISEGRKELFGLRFRHATGELENTAGLSAAKKDLARAITVAHARGINTDEIR